MDRSVAIRSRGPGVTATILALLLVLCLAESATDSIPFETKSSSDVPQPKVYQLRGSCLSYGHSCWGAHGKRSGRPPIAAPDWYLTRLLRRISSNSDINHASQLPVKNDDLSAIFQVEMPNNAAAPATDRLLSENQDISMEVAPRTMEAKPMLDDELLSKIKLWQIMREASEDN